MFTSTFQSQSVPQNGTNGQFRPDDTLTELCHAAEVFVPHELNKEYRLKRTFVDIGGDPRSSSAFPTLGAHQFVHARKQASRVAEAAKKPIEQCVPIEAVGYAGLKKRFDEQQDALKKQQEATDLMAQRLDREEREYRASVYERVTRLEKKRRTLTTSVIRLFRELDESRLSAAAEHAKTFRVCSHTGPARDDVEAVQEKARLQNMKSRILQLEKTAHLQQRESKPKRSREITAESEEEFRKTMRSVKLRVHKARLSIDKSERDLNIIAAYQNKDK